MPTAIIRNIPEETHRALKARAKKAGRSTEAELRLILQEAVHPKEKIGLGTEIRRLVEKFGGYDLKIERDKTPAGMISFE